MKQNINNVRKLREAKLMSKAELARKAGISVLTVDRIEKGHPCRLDTKRKVVIALGLRVPDADKVFKSRHMAAAREQK
jgi:transcriptional regulator with XRE-family HTH domain